MPRTYPLTTPATPIALCANNLLSPPPDRLINTPTTLSIARETPGRTFTVHLIRTHEPIDSPDRYVLLFTVSGKPWPHAQTRQICDAEGVPVLELRRVWMGSRRWAARCPAGQVDLLEASLPWSGGGSGSGATGFRFDVRCWNVLGTRSSNMGSQLYLSDPVPGLDSRSLGGFSDEPPSYASVAGDKEDQDEEEGIGIWRNEKRNPFSHSEHDLGAQPTPTARRDHETGSILPSYASVRRNSSNSIRDLLDAVEPPNEPAPAPSSSSLQTSGSLSASTPAGSEIDLKVMQLTASGIGVMMGDQKIIHIARHNTIDFGRSGTKSKWEAEVAEGVDLLLAVNIVLILASSA